jgi:hypothetical protein
VLLAGSFAAGTTLGLVSGGGGESDGGREHRDNGKSRKEKHRTMGWLASAIAPLQMQAASLAREAAEDLFTETRRAIKGGISDAKPSTGGQNGSAGQSTLSEAQYRTR